MDKRKKGTSIRRTTVDAMLLVIVVQILIIIGAIIISGVAGKLENNGFKIFAQTVNNRTSYVEEELRNSIMAVDGNVTDMASDYEANFKDKDTDNEMNILNFFETQVDTIIKLLRDSGGTGAFIILNDDTQNTNTHSSLYVVDNDPKYNDIKNNSDIFILKGPKEIFTNNKIPAHINWNYGITMKDKQKELFDIPYNAGVNYNENKELGYWYIGPDFYDNNNNMVAYVRPIIGATGNVIGVMGVEIGERYLFSMLPDNEISKDIGSGYILAKSDENEQFEPIIIDGAYLKKVFPRNEKIELTIVNEETQEYRLKNNNELAIIKEKLNIYDDNSPYESDDLYLMGVGDMKGITEGADDLKKAITVSVVLSLALSIGMALLIGEIISKPTTQMMKGIKEVKPGKEINLVKTGIVELDALAKSVEDLNKNVLESVLKTDKIISMVGTDIGFFAFNFKENDVDVSPTLISMFGLEDKVNKEGSIDLDIMMLTLERIKRNLVESDIYKIIDNDDEKWFKIESIGTETGELGVVIDVTKEEISKQALMRERDFDMLTGVYNRFAFHRIINKIVDKKNLQISAFAMGDLDNLKHINDTYGHDTGDLYIKAIADYLQIYFKDKRVLYARMSGDEFYIFVYGYESKEEVRDILYGFNISLGHQYIDLPDNTRFKLRMSMGLAWYPDDGEDVEELSKLADFAMYQGKHSIKGGIREFDKNVYDNESYMFTGKEELVSILDNQLFEYAFQPIINCSTGDIYGYEALIRPSGKTINTPDKLINLAKIQGQLWKVEKNTFYTVLELSKKYASYLEGCKIFINSVPNQVLNEMEYADLEYNYKEIIHRLVIEITEGENIDEVTLIRKKKLAEKWKAMIAIDDYGSGYANETLLVNLKPNIIKIDKFLVNDIENNKDKYVLVKNLINFAKKNLVTVVAEGVETKEQLETVMKLGVDMIQGFYIAKPMHLPNYDVTNIKEEIKNIKSKM